MTVLVALRASVALGGRRCVRRRQAQGRSAALYLSLLQRPICLLLQYDVLVRVCTRVGLVRRSIVKCRDTLAGAAGEEGCPTVEAVAYAVGSDHVPRHDRPLPPAL